MLMSDTLELTDNASRTIRLVLQGSPIFTASNPFLPIEKISPHRIDIGNLVRRDRHSSLWHTTSRSIEATSPNHKDMLEQLHLSIQLLALDREALWNEHVIYCRLRKKDFL